MAGGWGDLEAGWDADALRGGHGGADPARKNARSSSAPWSANSSARTTRKPGGHGEAFLSLDKGLSVLSKHAASLGYDGLILFLDELILWLASHAADLNFVHQEGQKLAKLVEAQTPDRPVPIISFVARQRDLSELIGDSVPGADRLNFSDALKHWEGRFHKITLEDRNLPAIAEKRVLKCKSEAARAELDAAFEQTAKIREAVMNTLLTSEGDREMFRKVYPFSPALVQTLIAVSSVLQRERTALKVMMQLLVDQRDTLTGRRPRPGRRPVRRDRPRRRGVQPGDGDPLRQRQAALPPEAAAGAGKTAWATRRPGAASLRRPQAGGVPQRRPAGEDPAAVRPGARGRIAAGAERRAAGGAESRHDQDADSRPRRTGSAAALPDLGGQCRRDSHRRRATNPTISVQLSGVDTETIIEQARREDNQGNRIRRVRQMLFEQLGIEGERSSSSTHDFLWRNTKRSCIVLFRNIRELPDASLENADERLEAGHRLPLRRSRVTARAMT